MLSLYLKRAGAVTGSLVKNTSHSSMEVIKKFLLGQAQFKGGETYLTFGSALHEQFLEDKAVYEVTEEESKQIKKMLTSLWKHPIVKSLMPNSIREQKRKSKLNGVEVAYILDIEQRQFNRGADLKTTNCPSLQSFIKKAKELGYFRQGKTYKLAAKLKHFYFIGIQKEAPHNVYILDVSEFPDEENYAERELEFLLYFYKHYGKVIELKKGEASTPIKLEAQNEVINNPMAKSGKEALSEINEAVKAHKANVKAAGKATKEAEKSKQKIVSLVGKFPKKEQELYQEKLNTAITTL